MAALILVRLRLTGFSESIIYRLEKHVLLYYRSVLS
jgi:hypothetical protein